MNKKIMHLIITVLGIAYLITSSCEKRDSLVTFDEFLSNKRIEEILLADNKLWVLSSTPQDFISITAVVPDYQISFLNLENNEFLMNDQIPAVIDIALDNSDKVYLATYDKKILVLNNDLSYELYFQMLDTTSIKSIAFDQDNDLWISTNKTGLYEFSGANTINYNTSNSILSSNNIGSMLIDFESNVWLVSCNDLLKIDDNITIVNDNNLESFNNFSCAFHLSFDKNNSLWVSKWDGNNHLILRKKNNSQWNEVEPFLSGSEYPIRFIESDREGNIWVAYSSYPKDRLAYYDSGLWNEILIELDEIVIQDVEINGDEIIVGTSKGIYKTIFH